MSKKIKVKHTRGRVTIEKGICEICNDESFMNYDNTVPKEWFDEDGFLKLEHKEEYFNGRKHYVEKFKQSKKDEFCFYFLADCGGDAIEICKKHLLEIISKIDELSNEL